MILSKSKYTDTDPTDSVYCPHIVNCKNVDRFREEHCAVCSQMAWHEEKSIVVKNFWKGRGRVQKIASFKYC